METNRQFRVLNQSLSIHSALRDRYTRRALAVDLLLLGSSVVFCASAFASDEALSHFGPPPTQVRYIIRISSVIAFVMSIFSLRIDWKGKAAQHKDAAAKMSRAIASFHQCRQPDGGWPAASAPELSRAYWEAMHNSVPIPEADFVKLKARHLRKMAISKMLDSNPGCPVIVLRATLWWSGLRRVARKPLEQGEGRHGDQRESD